MKGSTTAASTTQTSTLDNELEPRNGRVPSSSLKLGQLIRLKYQDAVLWADRDPVKYNDPCTLETCGWVASVSEKAVRIAWERLVEPSDLPKSGRFLQQGVTLVKSTIKEVEVLST